MFMASQQPTSDDGSQLEWKTFHGEDFGDFEPGRWMGTQVTFLKISGF